MSHGPCCVLFQAGLCVLTQKSSVVIDVLSQKCFESSDQKLLYNNMPSVLELSFCGICINNRFLVKIMGKRGLGKYLKKREKFTSDWRQEAFSHKDFPIFN